MKDYRACMLLVHLLACFHLLAGSARALEPAGVVVIANRQVPESTALAKYYMGRRGIPATNLITLATSQQEAISREDYLAEIRKPVLSALLRLPDVTRIRCLVLMYGMPLRVNPPVLSAGEQAAARELERARADLKSRLDETDDPLESERMKSELEDLSAALETLRQEDTRAALDSELMLILCGDQPLSGWLPNPHFIGFQGRDTPLKNQIILLVSRLDGPDAASVRRIVDHSIVAEQTGLSGTAYFDARGPKSSKEKLSDYALYDHAIHQAAEIIEQSGKMKVILDSRGELFGPGECPAAALYCGWYSLSKYVDAFDWALGAVGYHIASGECATLKREGSEVWCKRMLEDGVAATIGPVAEPYVQGFPLPDVFFGNLVEGTLSLAECYVISLPYLSWQMVLIGDPLYRPFATSSAAPPPPRW